MANSTFISLPITSGGGTSYTFTSPLQNSAGTVSLGIVPLSLGGAGASNAETIVSTGGTFNPYTAPTSVIRYTGTAVFNVTALVSDGTARKVTFINDSSNLINFTNQGGSIAVNKFQLPHSSSFQIFGGANNSSTFIFNTNAQRWYLLELFNPATATQDGLITASTQQIFSGNKTFTNNVSATNYLVPNLNPKSILYVNAANEIGQDANTFCYDYTTHRLGVQTSSPEASVHAFTLIPEIAVTPVNLVPTEVTLTDISGAPIIMTSLQQVATLATNVVAVQNPANSGYPAADGSTYTYHFYTDIGSPTEATGFTGTYTEFIFMDNNDGLPFSIDLSWDSYVGDNMTILLSVNGGDFDKGRIVGNGVFLTVDDNNFADPAVVTPVSPAYLTAGTTRNYLATLTDNDFNGYPYYSVGNYSYNAGPDANDNSYYVVVHSNNAGTTGMTKVIGAADGTSNNASFLWNNNNIDSFYETSASFTGNTVVTPTELGYTADSGVTRYYKVFGGKYLPTETIYSALPASTSQMDDGGHGFYGVQLNWDLDDSDFYLIQVGGDGVTYPDYIVIFVNQFMDDLAVPYINATPVLTPNSFYFPAAKFEGAFSTDDLTLNNLPPAEVIKTSVAKASDGYAKLDFIDPDGSMGYIQADSAGLHLKSPGEVVEIKDAYLTGSVTGPSGQVNFGSGITVAPGQIATFGGTVVASNGLVVLSASQYAGTQTYNNSVLDMFQTATPTTGQTVTCSAVIPGLLINPAGTLATLTIKLPSFPQNGQQYWVASTQVLTAVTWQDSGGTAGNVVGGQTTIGGTSRGQHFVYISSITKWIANS